MDWVTSVALPYFKLDRVNITEDPSWTKEYPDIWAQPATATITVTATWAKKDKHQRRVELAHEIIHIAWGWGHGPKEREKGYFSRPDRDAYTKQLYNQHLRRGK